MPSGCGSWRGLRTRGPAMASRAVETGRPTGAAMVAEHATRSRASGRRDGDREAFGATRRRARWTASMPSLDSCCATRTSRRTPSRKPSFDAGASCHKLRDVAALRRLAVPDPHAHRGGRAPAPAAARGDGPGHPAGTHRCARCRTARPRRPRSSSRPASGASRSTIGRSSCSTTTRVLPLPEVAVALGVQPGDGQVPLPLRDGGPPRGPQGRRPHRADVGRSRNELYVRIRTVGHRLAAQ